MQVEAKFAGQSVEDIIPLDDEGRQLLADEALKKLAIQEANEALAARTVSASALAEKSEGSALVAIVLEAARKMHT